MSGDPNPWTAEAAAAGSPAEVWARLSEQSNAQAQAMLELMRSAGGDPQQVQQRWLDALARSLDDFMRTPAFMEAMRDSLRAVVELKTMQNRFVQDTARQLGLPLAADIAGLFERVHSAEREILARLEAIETKLRAIETKLGPVAPGPA